jgi:adenylate kinase
MPQSEGVCDQDKTPLKRRPDDEESVVRNRLEVYKKQTEPIVGFYRQESILTKINAQQSPDAVFQSLLKEVA